MIRTAWAKQVAGVRGLPSKGKGCLGGAHYTTATGYAYPVAGAVVWMQTHWLRFWHFFAAHLLCLQYGAATTEACFQLQDMQQ
jgi:hypothetical protein